MPAKYLVRFGARPDETDQKKRFLAVLAALDDAIGRVLSGVDDLGLRENTIVMLISDNGAFMLPGRGLEVQSNGPLREGGITTYEGGLRVPAIVRWPGRISPGRDCGEMLSSLDVLPLIIAAAGGELPCDHTLDGRDPIKALAGESPSPHDALYWVWNQGRKYQWKALRQDRYKLVRPVDSQSWELYDLVDDISETKNLAFKHPKLVKELSDKFAEWRKGI